MIDSNGVYTEIDLDIAKEIVISMADTAGITIESGSVEDKIKNWLALYLQQYDTALFKSYQSQFYPSGPEIDIQNPNTPRLKARISQGYLKLSNATGADIPITINSTFTAPNGNAYTNGSNIVTVPAGGDAYIMIYSKLSGIEQNLPANQSFSSSYTLTAINPQPIEYGINNETDTEYLNRIVYDKTNYTSQQNTLAAVRELKLVYDDARIYVNNQNNATPLPLVVPANGYLPIVKFASGPTAPLAEIQEALEIFSNRYEFGQPYTISSALHPLLSGVIYTGTFPENYYVAPAQSVQSTISLTVSVKYQTNVDETEKLNLGNAFATYFVQNMINYFGGAAGDFTCNFTPIIGSPAASNIAVIANKGIYKTIAPSFSIEQVRALISDQSQLSTLTGLKYESCDALTYELDPLEAGESAVTLNIAGPTTKISFTDDVLFTDGSGWYDRYIYIDPSLITVNVNEI